MGKYKDEDTIIKGLHDHLFITHFDDENWFDQIMNQVVDEIKNTPDADVVEVVRCKDCKYAHMTMDGECKYCDIWFPDEKEYMDGDYYCASGERRDDTE